MHASIHTIMKDAWSGLAPVSIHMLLSKEMSCLLDVRRGRISFAVWDATSMHCDGTMYLQYNGCNHLINSMSACNMAVYKEWVHTSIYCTHIHRWCIQAMSMIHTVYINYVCEYSRCLCGPQYAHSSYIHAWIEFLVIRHIYFSMMHLILPT